ncbi:hypothetical protein ID866_1199 [Astraeus odoratus]|nr:hypothetical protein ID866_1199 [Astraeus odoratus]
MNKNPFVPQPTYNPQPPLPPGPPPTGPPDYSAYWAAAAAQQQQAQQPTAAYNTPWTAPQPPRPPPEQSALYANYGYGSQNVHWQQRQQQQQPYQPAPPIAPPPPPPPQAQPQPQYNPYHASVGFQPYVPQAPQPVMAQPTYQQPPQPMAPPQPYFPQQQPPQQQRPSHGVHHTPPHHLPPAKRQRYDGPSGNQQRQSGLPPPQPQFQPPPPPPNASGGGMYTQGQNQSQQGANQVPLGGNRGAMNNRGGIAGGARGKGPMGNRGGMSGQRGRGNPFVGSGGGRGGGQQGSLRGHGSRGGFGKQDFHSRRGGSFNAGHHQGNVGNTSFRGRGHGQGRTGRQDGPSAHAGNRDTSTGNFTSSGKKDENRRTLTDFKIVGLEMPELGWTWGVIPAIMKAEEKDAAVPLVDSSHDAVKQEAMEDTSPSGETTEAVSKGDNGPVQRTDPTATEAKAESSSAAHVAPPPSRIRIYFHTPVSPDDSHPIPLNPSLSLGAAPMDSRKGKRKKLEDDDADAEEGRERLPLPRSSQMSDTASNEMDGMGRASVAPSVAETASEGDWLMAAIAEDDIADADAHGDDEGQLCVSQVEDLQTLVSETKGLDDQTGVATDGNPITGVDSATASGGTSLSPPLIRREVDANAVVEEHALPGPEESVLPGPSVEAVATVQPAMDIIFTLEEDGGDVTHLEATQPASVGDERADNLFNSPLVEPSRLASQSSASLSSFDVASSRASAPPTAQSDMPRSAKEQSADHAGHPDAQVSPIRNRPKPLQAFPSLASTIMEDARDSGLFSQEEGGTSQPGRDVQPSSSTTSHDKNISQDNDQDHLPEPPASPTSNTLLSTSSGSAYDESTLVSTNVAPKKGRVPSANRLSISYAGGTRRLVIDAEVVQYLRVYRAAGRIEVYMTLEKEGDEEIKGVLIESLSDAAKSYSTLPVVTDTSATDETIPPFWKNPLPAKWVRSGDVQEWLKSIFGRMFWVAGDAADGWEKKIEVTDPDPAPTIWTVLEGWAVNSPVGVQTERQRFLKTHMTEADNLLEILLRLVRGERATPFSQSTPAISAPSISGPLLAALTHSGSHGAQQTHVSLAVLAIFYMAADYAQKVNGEKGKIEAEEKVGEIIRCLPSHLVYKSLDGIFKEWRADKKANHHDRTPINLPWNTYDSDNTVFSPQGRLHQVEYALEAVKQGSAAVGLRSKTHAILLALKVCSSLTLVSNATNAAQRSTGELASYQQKMFRIDDHVGIAIAGLTSDARVLSNFMRQQAMSERMVFNRPMPVNRLVSAIADKAQVNTQEYGRRPYGVGFLVIGQDQAGPHLFEFSPSGNSYEYFAMSIGARSQSAKTYLEKHYKSFEDCTLEELIKHGLHALRETLQQDKELNVNNTSIGIIGPTGVHDKPVSPPGKFRIIEGEPVAVYLESMEQKETADATTAPAVPASTDEDVQMSG